MGLYETLKKIGAPVLVAGTILTTQAQAQDTKPAPAPTATKAPAAGGMSKDDQELIDAVKRQQAQRKAAAAAAGDTIRQDAQRGTVSGDCTIVTVVEGHPEKTRAMMPPMPSATIDQMLKSMNKGALKHAKVCGPEAAALWSKAMAGSKPMTNEPK